MKRLERSFFERNTVEVAQSLIGCRLVRRIGEIEASAVIVETEAYRGSDDPASHAHRGVTPRNKLMFGQAGMLYVYFSYGMHHCMNIVTETEGQPGAVLLRAAEPVEGLDWFGMNRPRAARRQWMNGPGKLTQAFAVDLSQNGLDLANPEQYELVVMEGSAISVAASKRIGITKGTELLWRFTMAQG